MGYWTVGTNEGCLSGHYWGGSSQCSRYARLRCSCGAYVREDNMEAHVARCRVIAALADDGDDVG